MYQPSKNIVLVIILFFILTACKEGTTEITAQEFCDIYKLPVGTMKFSKFAGQHAGKAYIELHQMSSINSKKWSVEKYWANAEQINKACKLPK